MPDTPRAAPRAAPRSALRSALCKLAALIAPASHAPRIEAFALVVLSPVPLLGLGAVFGGLWAWAAFFWVGIFIFTLDVMIRRAAPDAPEGQEFPAADGLSQLLAGLHFGLLALAVWAISGGSGLDAVSRVPLFLAFGLFFGQVSNSNAHELIHRADKRLFLFGKWVYISLLFGHHTSAHRHVHHRFAATPDDPNTAQLGESFWAFAPRAWAGSFIAGWEMERARRLPRLQAEAALAQGPLARVRLWFAARRPYADYLLGGAAIALLVTLWFGAGGLLAYLALCAHAQIQLLLSDYVQHYGLERAALGNGRYAPVDETHSWDAPHPVSSLWMLNAPRHSDHHAHPARPYPALRLGETGAPGRPILPRSLPAMATLALFPRLWRRVMDKRVRALRKAQSVAQSAQ
ncbi:MAG: alkane 1-monooxygenase [Paracoccaceae bacterium]